MQWKPSILNASWIIHMLMQSDGMSTNWQRINSTFDVFQLSPFFAFVIYLIDNQLGFPVSLCLRSCFIFNFCYLVHLILRYFLKVEICVPTFIYFFNRYWILWGESLCTAHMISIGEKEISQSVNSRFGLIYLCHDARCKMTCFTRMEVQEENLGNL
jgi:hypothetical protein